MCWCRPEVRTPCCGRPECHPPGEAPITMAPRPANIDGKLAGVIQDLIKLRMALQRMTADIEIAGFNVLVDANGDYAGLAFGERGPDDGRTR